MLTSTALYREALPYAHRREVRVQVYQEGVLVGDSDTNPVLLPVAGSVQASLMSRVTRTLEMRVQPELFPAEPTDLMSPYASVLRISVGVGYPNGSREIFPVFTGRVTTVERDALGGVTINGEDLAADVIGFQFEQPQASQAGTLVTDEMERLILQALPSATFGAHDADGSLTPVLVWDTDRGRALDELGQAVRGRWYTLGNGDFVVRRYPYTVGTPVISIVDESGGLLVTAQRTVTRLGTANSVTVVSERMDGTDPIRVTVRDTNALSPTRFGGPYGRVSQVIKVQTPLTQGGAEQLAVTQLEATTALTEQWALSMVPDYTMEPGDTITVSYRSLAADQVIDRITYPLTLGAMELATRASVSPVVAG